MSVLGWVGGFERFTESSSPHPSPYFPPNNIENFFLLCKKKINKRKVVFFRKLLNAINLTFIGNFYDSRIFSSKIKQFSYFAPKNPLLNDIVLFPFAREHTIGALSTWGWFAPTLDSIHRLCLAQECILYCQSLLPTEKKKRKNERKKGKNC
jgi:hypothetical protein